METPGILDTWRGRALERLKAARRMSWALVERVPTTAPQNRQFLPSFHRYRGLRGYESLCFHPVISELRIPLSCHVQCNQLNALNSFNRFGLLPLCSSQFFNNQSGILYEDSRIALSRTDSAFLHRHHRDSALSLQLARRARLR